MGGGRGRGWRFDRVPGVSLIFLEGTMEICREFKYIDGEAVMLLYRKQHVNLGDKSKPEPKIVIPFRELWRFSEEHNEEFLNEIYPICESIYNKLRVGDMMTLSYRMKHQVMGNILQLIQEGIDEYISKPPDTDRPPSRVLGEIDIIVDGVVQDTVPLTNEMLENI